MSKKQKQQKVAPGKRQVPSMLDVMVDGQEYASLADVVLIASMSYRDEIRRAIADVEAERNRPLLCYAGNVVRAVEAPASINRTDDLPFSEMISVIPSQVTDVDVLLATPGGSGQQVSQFVTRMRPRFANVAFLIPQMAMSAGTIWALSGNEIWMDERGCFGPIDPQVPGRDGRLVPAQSIMTVLKYVQQMVQESQKRGMAAPWIASEIIANMDAKEIGNAQAQSAYAIQMASEYLEKYKFRDWQTHSNGTPVTPDEKRERAVEIAWLLCSHDQWKVHSHGISRDVLWTNLKLRIQHLESAPKLHRAIRRLWALFYWLFENTPIAKMFVSKSYSLFRSHAGDVQ